MLFLELILAGIAMAAFYIAWRAFGIQVEWYDFAKQAHIELLEGKS